MAGEWIASPACWLTRSAPYRLRAFDLDETEEPVADWQDPPWPLIPEPPAPPELDYSALPALAEGDGGTTGDGTVALAQALLNAAGSSPTLAVDGRFGPATRNAVIQRQLQSFIFPSGVIDTDTWLSLAPFGTRARLEPKPPGSPMTGPPVAVLQDVLNQAGAFPRLERHGTFDEPTRGALHDFQLNHGLAQGDAVDEATWRALAAVPLEMAPDGALRLIFEYDSDDWPTAGILPTGPPVHLAGFEALDLAPPRSEPLGVRPALAGFWVELWDRFDQPIYRRTIQTPIALAEETSGIDLEHPITRAPIAHPKGTFEVVVPHYGSMRAIAVFSSPLRRPLDPDSLTEPSTLQSVIRLSPPFL
jgi:hypothetical protein